MAFLDNSGDIILDAVLTDTGRHRLARGDGSFRIAKFALGDDEINYHLYDKNNPSGSAYYDLNILQTPVLEAFTNNTSLMKSKLISIPRTNLLYLPVIKQRTHGSRAAPYSGIGDGTSYLVCVDDDTQDEIDSAAGSGAISNGILFGSSPQDEENMIECHQGLDTTEIPRTFPLDADLVETQYILEIDNRLGQIFAPDGNSIAKVSFIDDDQIASYYLTLNTDTQYVKNFGNPTDKTKGGTAVLGPRGTKLMFKIKASIDLNSSTFLFTQLGDTVSAATLNLSNSAANFYYIDSTVRVNGATTGYRIDLPIRFIKKI